VDEEKSHGNDAVPAATDPVWQHATCDEYHHRVTWYFPGEDQPNHPPVAASAAKQPREVERPSTPKVETASEPNTQSSLAVQTPNEPSTLSQSPRVISIEPLQSAKGNADLGSADIQRIHATYENNQARFFRDFAGKRFSSKMPIARVSENVIFRGSFNVFLGPGGLLGDVQCEVSNKNDVARITEMNMGDIVTVSGVIKDHTLGVIELKDCSISASQ